ncbi:MAG: M50 family metallopeptidase [Thiohalorhabdus sp.]|uniref:M50 family metallopeptidase n=1 Tax=Thiohalorhabdus sp. TaxID=3094134 RepID=UPI0039816A28
MNGGIRLGSVAGIEVRMDWSLLVIFLLILVSLGAGTFPALHPQWALATSWATALVAAVLFFASVFLHELSHALVGRVYGITVRRITLFIFGGLAHMENEPRHWRGELLMALAGPVTSLALGVGFLLLGGLALGPEGLDPERPRESLARMSPVATLLFWLGPVNLILGVFNLVPGFPLDGGRVLRAVMWGITGNLRRATRWASRAGQGFAWLLILSGVALLLGARLPVLGAGPVNGLWLAFIGWFLHTAALASYRQLLVREALHDIPVRRLMQPDPVAVSPDTTLRALADGPFEETGQRVFPVVEGGRMVGLVGWPEVRARDRGMWDRVRVVEVMVPEERVARLAPGQEAEEALAVLTRAGVNQLPVVEDGRVLGLLRRRDLLHWVALHGDPELADLERGG